MARELLSDAPSSSDSEDGGVVLSNASDEFKVNEEFARKFEYNKKREELSRLEEKHGKSNLKRKRDEDEDDSDESTSESEDEGELDTEAVDAEMMATIKAIRNKDPRIYDEKAKFYTTLNEEPEDQPKPKKEKSMNLQDYHRQNLLNGTTASDDDDDEPMTYTQEQEQLRLDTVKQMHAAAEASESEAEGADFLVAKPKSKKSKSKPEPVLDVENADKDPETFLSNFMSSRAWKTQTDRNLVPFESDDEDEERKADEFEEAYNMRFEDPAKANEKLRSHARDMAAKYSVRRDETNPRQKKREAEKERKEIHKQEMKEEKARLRKLKVEEVEEKVRRIKRAAGLKSKDIKPEDWSQFVDEDWDDDQWEAEMQKRFGEQYYAEDDVESEDEIDANGTITDRRKPKKPKFDDDIDINDIIPDYQDEDGQQFSLSDDEQPEATSKPKKQSHKQAKAEKQRESKRERRIIEALVDDQLKYDLDRALPSSSKHKPDFSTADSDAPRVGFRYRATSPTSFGLSNLDILLADDSQLNQYAGLKKLAAFRDQEKKSKDKKHLGKKARLRKWRAEVFGNEDGVDASSLVPSKAVGSKRSAIDEDDEDNANGGANIVEGGRKKKRRRKGKKAGEGEI